MTYDDTVDATHPGNPSPLPPRYQIRRLTEEHRLWVTAIFCHSNTFHSTLFTKAYPDNLGERFKDGMVAVAPFLDHSIQSKLSYGVFDTQFPYKHDSSRAAGGKFLWTPQDPPCDSATLIAAMDFPLVSIAMSYDLANPPEAWRISAVLELMPIWRNSVRILTEGDRTPEVRQPKGHGIVLKRNGTSTRVDYEGTGLMAGTARWLMREAQLRGYKGILIDAANDAVTHVWTHPKQKGMTGKTVSAYNAQEVEEMGPDGKMIRVFGTSTQRVTRNWVDLDAF